ncbi:DUF4062 domain-containing protein [Gimesia aquarii]|uniref:DUF4062 domain-containing protein n=1 Tax=Gimesia aquarii TaxID=2527964 RepID=A0A517X1A6_9PLAN|nr:DUF4062 domain-containing protein [Gimesia aquarii]QDU11288.1 hypothetical protein V202x_47070 [Gimesia aquarii]
MEKRYQVFVSSMYTDLKDERQQVMQALMEMDCIPAGMELFPAADEEQWQFIKRIIDDCDYYLLIIGGRYGSVTNEGISFTEKEYKYAKSKKLRIVALLHQSPEELPAKFVEADPELKTKLDEFRQQVANGRLVKFWNSTEQLIGLVALSMQKTIKMYPSKGWISASSVTTEELLLDNNRIRVENRELKQQLEKLTRSNESFEKVNSHLPQDYVIEGTGRAKDSSDSKDRIPWKVAFNLRDVFIMLAPHLMAPLDEYEVEDHVADILKLLHPNMPESTSLEQRFLKDIGTLFRAVNLIIIDVQLDKTYANYFWSLTQLGDRRQIPLGRAVAICADNTGTALVNLCVRRSTNNEIQTH